MNNLAWKINRIKAMGLGEVLFRVKRLFLTKIEKKRLATGWVPKPHNPVTSAARLFTQDSDHINKTWAEWFGSLDEACYEAALNKARLFGDLEIDISREINWHLDPESGITAPLLFGKDIDYRDNHVVGNCKTLWELSRHKHLVPLSTAYVLTGSDQYANKVIEHIESWIEQNPYGYGVHWCSSLEVSLRLISWAFCHHLFMLRDAKGLFGRLSKPDRFSVVVYQHVYFIINYLSRYSSANNHLIGELTGIWVGCKLFDLGKQGQEWSQFAKQELEAEGIKQVYSDGVSREQAIYYHLWVNEYFLLSWLVALRYRDDFKDDFAQRITKMTQFIVDVMSTSERIPQIGDSDDGVVISFDPANLANPFHEIISTVDAIGSLRKPDNNEASLKSYWYNLVFESSNRTEDRIPALNKKRSDLKVYKEGGYVILHDESTDVIMDVGGLGYPSIAAHGHADALSICLAFEGEWWLVDPGTYCYHTERDWRDYFRGTGAHNTLLLNGKDQSLIGGSFLWLKHADVRFEGVERNNKSIRVSGSVLGHAYGSLLHRRNIEFNNHDHSLIVEDQVTGDQEGEFEVRYHFHPHVELSNESTSDIIAVHKNVQGKILIHLDENLDWEIVSGQIQPHLGWYSDSLGTKAPSPVLIGKGVLTNIDKCKVIIEWLSPNTCKT